ncbi:hypothetical protein GGF46_001956 [Coemansia sp. RSA 552]|nr:hypothetical protein GGF46_001956 [Coemansia sp. RSA 552]
MCRRKRRMTRENAQPSPKRAAGQAEEDSTTPLVSPAPSPAKSMSISPATPRSGTNDQTALETPVRKVPLPNDDNQWTPQRLSQTLRPSGSPTRVSGSKVVASVKFTEASGRGLCKVDKSLVCKGFWETIEEAGRICLPRRSGKTYNLTQLLLFFSMLPEQAKVSEVPDSILGRDDVAQMDVATKCRLKRECLFQDSLLRTMHPAFFSEHFMKYPVVHLSLSECKGETLGDFVMNLCGIFAGAAEQWLENYYSTRAQATTTIPIYVQKLEQLIKRCVTISSETGDCAVQYKNLPQMIFKSLSNLITKAFGRYILLIDEYDIPFISVCLASWSRADKAAAQGILKLLFQSMLKDNDGLRKGLLMGVFEIPLTEMGSGANNVKDVRMVPAERSDIHSSVLAAGMAHSGGGLDALTDSFWFNAGEVAAMLDNSTRWCARIADHKQYILDTIRDWYNGYFIGRFRGKYNPWSVSSFIESLCGLLNQAAPTAVEDAVLAAARPYWVTTGTTGLIEAQIDRHRLKFAALAKRLLRSYDAGRRKRRLSSSVHVQLTSTRLNMMALDSDRFSESGLLTLCLYAGYLTREQSMSVCIPNHEVYQVWQELFARAVLGTELTDSSTNLERGALLKELWHGKTDILGVLATSSHAVLSNHNKYNEADYANHVANTIMAVTRFGMLSHPDQETIDISDVVVIRENETGLGKSDYIMRLRSPNNVANQFGVIIEFKVIGAGRRKDTGHHVERATCGLKQIAEKNYDACLAGCRLRLDIGVAIGNNAVYCIPKMHKRKSPDGPWIETDSLIDP